MTIGPRRLLTVALLATASLAQLGCGGDNPANQAGTIELPERKFTPPIDAKSFAKDKANPKAPAP